MRRKLPTLVLQLQQRASGGRHENHHPQQQQFHSSGNHGSKKLARMSDEELDQYLASNVNDFKREMMENIDHFHRQVISAKPSRSSGKKKLPLVL